MKPINAASACVLGLMLVTGLGRGLLPEQYFYKGTVLNITDVTLKCVLRFRRCMSDPRNPFNISLLDPLQFALDHLANRHSLSLHGVINGTVTDLSQFDVSYLMVTVASTSARMRISLPALTLAGEYDMGGSAADVLPLYGAGPYRAQMSNVTVDMVAVLGSSPSGDLAMTDFSVHVSPAAFTMALGGLLGGGALGQLTSRVLQDSAPQVLERVRPLATADLQHTVLSAANTRLRGVTLLRLVDWMLDFGNHTDEC